VTVALLSATACVAFSFWWGQRLRFQALDDAYITLRAASNWAAGNGPVFNAGELVESTTSPLWTALLAAGVRAGAPAEYLLGALGLVFAAAAAALSCLVATEMGGLVAGATAGGLIAALPTWTGWTFSGMEVSLAGLAIGAAAWSAARARPVASGLLCAVAALTRPESLVVVPVLAFFASATVGRPRLRPLLCFAAACALPLGAALIARHAYFGAWVPNTYVAKRSGLGAFAVVRGAVYVGSFFLLHPALTLAIGWTAASPRRLKKCIAATCIAFVAAVAWEGGDHCGNYRLIAPGLPLACAAAGSLAARFRWPALAGAVVVATAPLPAITGLVDPVGSFGPSRPGTKFLRDEAGLTRNAREAGEALAALPRGTVATVTIGAIGYYSGRPILDLVGLADQTIARSPHLAGVAPGHDHADVEYVLSRKPEMAVMVPELGEQVWNAADEERWLEGRRRYFCAALLLLEDPRFRASYSPVDVRAADGRHLRVWARKGWLAEERLEDVIGSPR
jgi:hypothetical protein